MTSHRPPGPSVGPFRRGPVLVTPDTRPSPAQLTAPALRQRLDEARTDYAEGRTASAARVAREVEATARHAIATSDDPSAAASVAGIAATLQGLCADADDSDALAVDAFARALDAFEQTGPATTEVGQYSAYRGIALAMTGRHGDAVPMLRRALSLGEDTPDVRRCLGISLLHSGQVQEAREVLEDAVRHAPDDWQAAEGLAALVEEAGADSCTRADAWQRTATAELDAGRFERAVTAAERAAELAEDDFTVTLTLGRALALAGRGDAAAVLQQALRLAPDSAATIEVADVLGQVGEFEAAVSVADEVLTRETSPDALGVLARGLLMLDRATEAGEAADRLVRLVPDSPAAQLLAGQVAFASGMLDQALERLNEADQLAPGDPTVLTNLAAAFADHHELERGIEALDRALMGAPGYSPALALRGRLKADLKDLTAAEPDLRRAVELEPSRTTAVPWLASVLVRQGRLDNALAVLDHSIRIDPEWPVSWSLRGDVLAEQGRYAEARDSFEQTLGLDAELAPALVGHANASLNLSDDGDPEAAAAAEATVRRAIELDPSSGEAHALLGEALRRQGRYPESLASLDEALRLTPDYPYASATAGRVLLDSGRPREAIKPLTTAVEAEPDDPSLLALLAYAYLESADPTDADGLQHDAGSAVQHLLHALTLDRQNPELLAVLAQALIYQGRLDAARTALRESLNLDPDSWDRAAALVEVLLQLGRPQEALDELTRHQRAEVPALRGRAFYAMDRYQEAVESLKEALAVEGSTPDTLYLLGDSYRLLGRLDDALDSLDRAIDLDPEADQALASRGVVHSMRGENQEALTDLEQAVEFAPGSVFAVRRLWLLHNDSGHPERAVEAVKGALAREEDNIELLKEHAFVLNAVGRQSETQRVLDDVLWRSPDDFEALQLLGWSMLDSRRRPEALAAFRRALRAAERTSAPPEQCAAALADLASAQNQCGRFTAALRTVNRALEVSRNHATLLTKGQILADVAAWPQALDVLRDAVRTPPYDSAGYSLLGWALEHSEGTSRQEVYQAYRKAFELAVGDPNVRRDLADGLWLLGKADEASEEYRWAADNLGKIGSSEAQYTRGWCLYRLGRSAEASSAYLRALPGSTALAPLLFDIGLNALEAGDDARARDAYHKAFAEVANQASAKARGPLSVALVDLRDARRLSRGVREGAAFDELEQRLIEELASRPLPQIA